MRPSNRWESYANKYLLHRVLSLGGICDYDIDDDARRRWVKNGSLPKAKNPELLARVLRAKNEIVDQATKDHANGERWSDDDFVDVIQSAIDSAINQREAV